MTQQLEQPKVQVTSMIDKNLVDLITSVKGRRSRSAFINDCVAYTLKSDNIPSGDADLDDFYNTTMKRINNARKGIYREEP